MSLSQPSNENTPVAPMPVEAVPPTKRSPESGVFKVENVPQLNEAMQLLNEVKDGDYAEFAKLAHQLVEAKLVATKPIKGHGCTYTVKRSKKAGEQLPLSEAKSKQLADALNSKLDTEAMQVAAEAYRAERGQKKKEHEERAKTAHYLRRKVTSGVLQEQGGKFMLTDEAMDEISQKRYHREQRGKEAKAGVKAEVETQVETIEGLPIEELLTTIPSITDRNDLNQLISHLKRLNLLTFHYNKEAKRKEMVATKHPASQDIVDTLKAQLRTLNQMDGRVRGLIKRTQECTTSGKLFGTAQWIASEKIGLVTMERTGRGRNDWVVKMIDGKYGSQAVVDEIMNKKAELEAEEKREQARKGREGVQGVLSRYRN